MSNRRFSYILLSIGVVIALAGATIVFAVKAGNGHFTSEQNYEQIFYCVLGIAIMVVGTGIAISALWERYHS